MATRDELLAYASSQIGTGETPPGSNKTIYAAIAGHPNGYAWCATFVVACMRSVGIKLPSESAYTVAMDNGFRATGAHVDPAHDLQPGDVIFFDFVAPFNSRGIQHVGIFVKYLGGGQIETIEGNTSSGSHGSQDNGDGVYKRERPLSFVVSAGRPIYDAAHVAPPAPAEVPTVHPDYSPAIVMPKIVASLGAPNGGVWLAGEHGEIYAFWAKDLDGPNRHPEYWPAGKVAVDLVPSDNGYGYKVISADGSPYNYDGPVEGHASDNQRKFDPAIVMPKIVSAAGARNGGVRLLGEHGELYCFSAADHDAPNRHPEYWPAGHLAAKIFDIPDTDGYMVVDVEGHNYSYPG